MKRKKLKIALVAAALVIICSVVFYRMNFPLDFKVSVLEQTGTEFLTHDNEPVPTVKFLGKGVYLYKTEYYIISVDGRFGYVKLKEGPFGRHRIEHVSTGSGEFITGIVEIAGNKFLLFAGMDYGGYISDIKLELQGHTYELPLGKRQEHSPFLTYCEISSEITQRHVDLENIWFYDTEGTDITENYNLSGGIFQ